MIIDYASFRTDIHFLQYKQTYIHNPFWMGAFYTHVFTGILTLMAGFTQFSDFFLKNHREARKTASHFLPLKTQRIKENEPDAQVEYHKRTYKTNGSKNPGIFAAVLLDSPVNESGE